MILIRQALADLRLQEQLDNTQIIKDAVAYFDRQKDHEQIRTAIINRYGVSVKSEKVPGDGTGVLESYVRGEFKEQVDTGQVENFSIGFAPKVTGALATLFTEKTQKWSLTHETAEDVEAAEKLLFEHNRDNTGFSSTLVSTDKLSVQIGSAAIFIEFARGRLSYRKFSPADILPYFQDYVIEDGKRRAVDNTDLEDATAVVINLGTNDNMAYNYIAFFGRSDEYENGRCVQFQGPNPLTSIPEVGDKLAIEHEIDGEIANPLTWWGNQKENIDKDIPEYPIIVLKGGMTEQNNPLPTYTSLYEAAKEFDIAASHTEHGGQMAVSGSRFLKRTSEAEGHPIPPSLTGEQALAPGQDVFQVPHDSAALKIALENTEKNMLHCASGYGVPDYMVMSQDHTQDSSSGVALAVKTMPLSKQRDYRIELNKPAVMRLFEVEKAYIGIHAPTDVLDADIRLLLECSLNWEPGEMKLPENKKERTERNIALRDAGAIDEIEFIRREHELPSDEEAIDLYEKMKERAGDYPPLKKEEKPKPALGLRGKQFGVDTNAR